MFLSVAPRIYSPFEGPRSHTHLIVYIFTQRGGKNENIIICLIFASFLFCYFWKEYTTLFLLTKN